MKVLWIFLLTISVYPLTGHAVPSIPECGPLLQKDQICLGKISDLHPMQSSVGMHEVLKKVKKFSGLSAANFDAYLVSNPVPVIIGPNRFIAPVDHHHLASSILASGHDSAVFKVLDNWETLSMDQFWQKMNDNHYVYLKDSLGNPITPAQLPTSIALLSDDPYRSLAGAVEDKGGFIKAAYFIEFTWGLFFRNYITVDAINDDFKQAVKDAVKIAHSQDAKDQPGFSAVRVREQDDSDASDDADSDTQGSSAQTPTNAI